MRYVRRIVRLVEKNKMPEGALKLAAEFVRLNGQRHEVEKNKMPEGALKPRRVLSYLAS